MPDVAKRETYFLHGEEETLSFGNELAGRLSKGLVFLHGDLGAGKTTLTRGILRGLGYEGRVRSPTYTLMEKYELKGGSVCHFDLYRMADPEELEFLGARDELVPENLCLIEWPKRGKGWLGHQNLDICLTFSRQPTENIEKVGRQIDLYWQTSI